MCRKYSCRELILCLTRADAYPLKTATLDSITKRANPQYIFEFERSPLDLYMFLTGKAPAKLLVRMDSSIERPQTAIEELKTYAAIQDFKDLEIVIY